MEKEPKGVRGKPGVRGQFRAHLDDAFWNKFLTRTGSRLIGLESLVPERERKLPRPPNSYERKNKSTLLRELRTHHHQQPPPSTHSNPIRGESEDKVDPHRVQELKEVVQATSQTVKFSGLPFVIKSSPNAIPMIKFVCLLCREKSRTV